MARWAVCRSRSVSIGKEFLAGAVGLAAASLAIDAKPLPAYTPHLKGVVERVNSSIEQLFLATLPGFVHGARGRNGKLVEDGPLLGLEALVELFAAFVVQYNTVRRHQGLAGRTPMQAWNADSTRWWWYRPGIYGTCCSHGSSAR